MTNNITPTELVALGIYGNERDAIDDGIRHILRSHPEYKIEIAVKKYKQEEVSLGKAADIAGVSIEDMKELLRTRGIAIKGIESIKEIQEDVDRARKTIQL